MRANSAIPPSHITGINNQVKNANAANPVKTATIPTITAEIFAAAHKILARVLTA